MRKKVWFIVTLFAAAWVYIAVLHQIGNLERKAQERAEEVSRQVAPWKALAGAQRDKLEVKSFELGLHQKTLSRIMGGEDPAVMLVSSLLELGKARNSLGELEYDNMMLEQQLADALFAQKITEELLSDMLEINQILVIQNTELALKLSEAQDIIEQLRGENKQGLGEEGEEKLGI